MARVMNSVAPQHCAGLLKEHAASKDCLESLKPTEVNGNEGVLNPRTVYWKKIIIILYLKGSPI